MDVFSKIIKTPSVVAEIGLCHNGSIELAKEMIKQCADAGATAVKFQKRDVENLAISSVLNSIDGRFPNFGETYKQIREHIEFSLDEFQELFEYAKNIGIPIFSSVFDVKSAKDLASLGSKCFKVASHCLTHMPLINYLAENKLDTLISTGMATMEEVDLSINMLKSAGCRVGIYHCVSKYPHTSKDANLLMIKKLKDRYGLPVGYSSHEPDNISAFLAIAMGAMSIEKHVTLDNNLEGFDHKIAQNIDGLKDLVTGVENAYLSLGNGMKMITKDEALTREKYHWSIVPTKTIQEGDTLSENNITVKNPSGGIPSKFFYQVLGKKARKELKKDTFFQLSDLSN